MKRTHVPGPQGGRRLAKAIEATGSRTTKLPQVRVTDDEDEKVKRLARKHGLTLAEWIRRRVTTESAVK